MTSLRSLGVTAALLTTPLAVGMAPVPIAVAPPSCAIAVGNGTAGNPYQVSTAVHLAAVGVGACGLDKAYLQTADITLAGSWTPIGSSNAPFTGTYDGGGKTIAALTINTPTVAGVGMFAATASPAVIRDVTLSGVTIDGANNTGGLIGMAEDTDISGVTVSGVVRGQKQAGAIAGVFSAGTRDITITDITVSADVRAMTRQWTGERAGGLFGYVQTLNGRDLTISRVSVTGDVWADVAGFAGLLAPILSTGGTGSDVALTDLRMSPGSSAATDGEVVGGVIGDLTSGSPGGSVTLARVDMQGGVEAGDGYAGGVAAKISATARVDINTIAVSGPVAADYNAGGLTGYIIVSGTDPVDITIRDTAVRSAVAAPVYGSVGGLIGAAEDYGSGPDTLSIARSYAAGAVTGDHAGGLVGGGATYAGWPHFTDSTWNTQGTGQAATMGVGAVGSTTAQMTTLSTFTSMSWPIVSGTATPGPSSVWGICPSLDDGYPFLQWAIAPATCPGAPGPEPEPASGGGASGSQEAGTTPAPAPSGPVTATASALPVRSIQLVAGRGGSPGLLRTVVVVPGAGDVRQVVTVGSAAAQAHEVRSACTVTAHVLAAGPVTLACPLRKSALASARLRRMPLTVITAFTGADGTSARAVSRVAIGRARTARGHIPVTG